MWRKQLRAALAWRLHAPRTVRVRLALLCAGVILVSGGTLLSIAFAAGGHQSFASGVVAQGIDLGPGQFVIVRREGATGAAPSGATGSASGGTAHGVGALPSIFASPDALTSPGDLTSPDAVPSPLTVHESAGGVTITQVTHSAAAFGSTSAIRHLLAWSIVGLAIVTAVGLALGWLLSGRMLRPLRTMRDTAQQISEHNLHERLALSGPEGDELKDLGDTIDALLARLEAAFDAQRRFVQNASHELRTPIAMMRTSLDVATGKPNGVPVEVTVLANKLGEGLDQAERLLEGFLGLARAQSDTVGERTAVPLAGAVVEALEHRADEVAALGLAAEVDLDGTTAFGSPVLLPQIVTNLVDNAVLHNVRGGWIRIATSSGPSVARLVVENGGAPLDPARVAGLGQPFRRLVDRTASERGAGLGLSIVSVIARSAGGTVALRAREEGGLHVTVELPAAPLPVAAEKLPLAAGAEKRSPATVETR